MMNELCTLIHLVLICVYLRVRTFAFEAWIARCSATNALTL